MLDSACLSKLSPPTPVIDKSLKKDLLERVGCKKLLTIFSV
jgi:hypothetical protein